MVGVIQWHRVAKEMDALRRPLVGGITCVNGLPDPQTRIHIRLTTLEPSITADLNAFAVEPSPRDSTFFADRLRPLIQLAATLALANFNADVQIVEAIIGVQVTRLRQGGDARCRSPAGRRETT